jgi:hypothetical protein
MQLECLLRSVTDNTKVFEKIIIQCSVGDRFMDSYHKLVHQYKNVTFVIETTFINTFKEILNLVDGYTCLMVDDDVMFNKLTMFDIDKKQPFDILSLRLGDNIKQGVHLEYKASLDGNIFRKDILEQVPLDPKITNPNKLEVALIGICRPYYMKRFTKPKVIGVPNNRVSDTSSCSYMTDNIDLLNNMFKNGVRIDYEKMDFKHNNVHKEVEYIFTKRFTL